jgi:hypothetical protein
VSNKDRTYSARKGSDFTDRHDSPTSPYSHYSADETGFEPVLMRLQRIALPLELLILFVGPVRFELTTPV